MYRKKKDLVSAIEGGLGKNWRNIMCSLGAPSREFGNGLGNWCSQGYLGKGSTLVSVCGNWSSHGSLHGQGNWYGTEIIYTGIGAAQEL